MHPTSPRSFEYWFDFSCPFAFIASRRVEALAARTGAELVAKPMLLGGVFRAIGEPDDLAGSLAASKARHNLNDIRRNAALHDVPLVIPNGHPRRTVTALRALLAAGEPFLPLAHRFFRAYWIDGIDLSTRDGVKAVLLDAGLDAEQILARAESQEIKDELRKRTDEAVQRGVFGAPTFVTGGELFFGQDRMADLEAALGGTPTPPDLGAPADSAPVELFFDYTSSYSYLAVNRAYDVFGEALKLRPFLLGAVMKAAGNTPRYSAAKVRFLAADTARQAKKLGLRFTPPSRFPMKTVLPLRVTLLAGAGETPQGRELIRSLFQAAYADDQDVADPSVVAAIATRAGLDGPALVKEAESENAKTLLRETTDRAIAAGAFGAPAILVHRGPEPSLYWGNDRLELAARAARGDLRLL